ncbi:hypothetical protein ALC56_05725 [Trachymyrmex septentrionalis]|uniref:Uncharacterized protein n=1 Tax=Trachymyrmex septentrionalis TaxID=34720 RepID=A0A195FI73_9HYME|nr:PREDICTED: uncharacterized protein LOC108748022 [Trachymyrmex septentrionalis]KYN39957.1 hypothetical protein ALC56_05725 [Trachymyrmex septentrionalis]
MKTKVIILLALQLLTLVIAGSGQEDGNSLEQLEEKLMKTMDEINRKDIIDVYGDIITLEKVAKDEKPSEESADPLVSRIEKFLRSRKIQINLPNDASTAGLFARALGQRNIDIELRSLTRGTSEARTKLKRMIMPLLILLKLKAIIVLPIVISMIALIGLKGLGAGLMSLLISGAVALKALVTPPPPARVSYGIVRPHEIHHDHWHRSEEEVNQPYRGWAPEYNGEHYP